MTSIISLFYLNIMPCNICFVTESAEASDYVPKEDVRRVLSQYLSGLTLTNDDAFGLRLPEKEIPEGFHLIHKRSSRRTVYTTKPGFSVILSKESSWRSVVAEERTRESVIVRQLS